MTIIFPDSELWLTGALRAALVDAFVSTSVPTTRRPKEVILRRDGGPDDLVQSRQRFGFRVFATQEKAATDLADLAAAHLRGLRFTGPILRVTTTSPFPVEDVSGIPMRYFTAEVSVRGTPLAGP